MSPSPVLALFVRILREQNRSGAIFSLRVSIGLLLLFCLWTAHEASGWSGAPGKEFFGTVIGVNYMLVTAAALKIGCQSIAEEKEADALGLLRLTNLNPLSILLGKAGGQLIALLLILALEIPFTLLAVTLGGVSVRQVFGAYALVGSYLFALTCLGILFSVLLAKVWRAALMTVCFALGIALLPVILQSVVDRLTPTSMQMDPLTGRIVAVRLDDSEHPIRTKIAKAAGDAAVWTNSVLPQTHARQLIGSSYLNTAFSRSLLVHTGFGLLFFLLAWLLFERFCGDESAYGESRLGKPARQRFCLLRTARPGRLAIAWKDFHFHFGGKVWFLLRLFAYPALLAVVIWQSNLTITPRMIANRAWVLGVLILYLDATIFVLRSWSPEIWGRNLSQLLLAPNSLQRLTVEKLAGFCVAVIPSLMLPLLAVGMEIHRGGPVSSLRGLLMFASVLAQSLFFFSLLLNLSLRSRWAALPGAFAIWLLVYMLLQTAMMALTLPLLVKGRWVSMRSFEVMQLVEVAVFALAAVAIYLNTQRLLIRRAAES